MPGRDYERGTNEKSEFLDKSFLSGEEFRLAQTPVSVLAQAGTAGTAASPAPTAAGGQAPPQRPQLAKDFSEKFEKDKADFLKQVGLNPANPLTVELWRPQITVSARDLIDQGTDEATQGIDEVLREMGQQIIESYDWEQIPPGLAAFALNDCLKDLLKKHFKATSPAQMDFSVLEIFVVLPKVRDDPSGINSGLVTYNYGRELKLPVVREYGCSAQTPGFTRPRSKTKSTLCPMLFKDALNEYPSTETLAQTLIHESLHRIEKWSDTAYEDNKTTYNAMTWFEAQTNPDSYAAFVRDARKCLRQTTLRDVFFDFNSATLTAEAKRVLNENIMWLQAHSTVRIRLEGHADERGSASYNRVLGDQRASAVRDNLNAGGIGLTRMATHSFGESRPFRQEQGEWAWRFNRRVHFVVVGSR